VEADYSSVCLTLCPNRETKQQRMSWFGSTATRPTATPGHRKKAPRLAGARLSARVPGRSPLAVGGRSPPSVRTRPDALPWACVTYRATVVGTANFTY
jgi:hypothetical protein